MMEAQRWGEAGGRAFGPLGRVGLASALAGLVFGAAALPLHAEVDATRVAEAVRTMAGDFFEGRAPGTLGEERTLGYLIGQFQALGLEPGGAAGSWLQEVRLLHTRLGEPAALGFAAKGKASAWRQGEEVYVTTVRAEPRVAVSEAPVVFVGHGVNAPERNWDDFKGADLRGKVALFLVNDPDFAAAPGEPAAGRFGGKAMTYYGRWTYKFEEATRRGAVAALVIHETGAAGYGWNVAASGGGENFALPAEAGAGQPLALQGWLSEGAAKQILAAGGFDLDAQRKAARDPGFRAVELPGVRFNADIPVTSREIRSHNVLARIAGAEHPDEVVFYGAHWDAYGKGAPDAQGRTIRGGANDDALGVAGLFEIAREFKAGKAPQRSVVFGVWTAEEHGLLGSEAYARDPVYPHARTVANLTIDILQTAGKARDVILVGAGQNALEEDLARLARAQGRSVTPESLPERGLFFRADHFSFARRGVPVILMMGFAGASDLVEGGREAGQRWVDDYTGRCYHQPCDAWGPEWNLAGAVEDIALMYELGRDLADSRRWPGWKEGSEFRAVREASAAERR